MKFDQCLFGYDDGHRLVASSIPLGTETSLLTELSDLAPGTAFNRSNGYWTGLPVPALGCYVLMRTWPAPEMSRPGCVWTHALLIPPSLFESLDDLSVLQRFAVRPTGSGDKERYRKTLDLDLVEIGSSSASLDAGVVAQLLLSLYASTPKPIEIDTVGQLDAPLFAVWSQQWPRLRRNLRFRTSLSRGTGGPSSTRFDVTAEFRQASIAQSSGLLETTPWLVAAASDVAAGAKGTLRPFLWSYGKDVKKQRGSFLPLTRIKMIEMVCDKEAAADLIDLVTEAFPSPDDAQLLKQDLVNGALVPSTQPQVLEWLLSDLAGRSVLPTPSAASLLRLPMLWPDRREEMLSLLEAAIGVDDPLGGAIIECLLSVSGDSLIWLASAGSLEVQTRLVEAKPDLLLEDWALNLESSALARLIMLVHDQIPSFERILPTFLVRDDSLLVEVFFDCFPITTAQQVMLSVGQSSNRIPNVWWHALKKLPEVLFHPDVISCFTRGSQLYALAEFLDWQVPRDSLSSAQLWSTTFKRAINDLSAERSDKLHCFLVKLAISTGGVGGMTLVEQVYNHIHDQLMGARLAKPAKDMLWDVLADAGWFKGWDIALRFRLAVATAYVKYQWPPLSYSRLSATRKGRKLLADAASEVWDGGAYAEAAGR